MTSSRPRLRLDGLMALQMITFSVTTAPTILVGAVSSPFENQRPLSNGKPHRTLSPNGCDRAGAKDFGSN